MGLGEPECRHAAIVAEDERAALTLEVESTIARVRPRDERRATAEAQPSHIAVTGTTGDLDP